LPATTPGKVKLCHPKKAPKISYLHKHQTNIPVKPLNNFKCQIFSKYVTNYSVIISLPPKTWKIAEEAEH
jgi:hypothetical protein